MAPWKEPVPRMPSPEKQYLATWLKTAHSITAVSDMFFGFIPGSIGETSAFSLFAGGVISWSFRKIASWRIMVSAVAGALDNGTYF